MSIADQIDSYLMARLRTIRLGAVINGHTCLTDAGALVYKAQEFSEAPDHGPFLILFTGKNSVSFDGDPAPELGMENHLLECSVESIIPDTKDGTAGDALKADLAAALRYDYTLGGLAENIIGWESDSEVTIGDEVVSAVKVAFTVLYTVPFGSE